MEMSKNELARRYRAAGSSMQERKRQITTLAELNGCTAADIRKALLEAGIKEEDLPNKPGPKKEGRAQKPQSRQKKHRQQKTKQKSRPLLQENPGCQQP